jgi:hypothetical protein
MIAVAGIATCVGADGAGLEAAHAVTPPRARRSMERVKASTTKTTSRMNAATAVETAATASMETAATTTVEAAAPAPTRLG